MIPYKEIQQKFLEAAQQGHAKASGWVHTRCPLCFRVKGSHGSKNSLGVNLINGASKCFRCGTKCNVYSNGARRIQVQEKQEFTAPSLDGYYPLHGPEARSSEWHMLAQNYLESRDLLKHAETANMHLALTGRFAGRILLPHVDARGTVWGWTARLIGTPSEEHIPRVLYTSGMDRDRMYNDQALEMETPVRLAVVEGVIDSLNLMPHAVAALGKPTDAHFDLLMTAKRPVVFVLDGDTGSFGRQLALKMKLKGFKHGAGYVQLDCGSDPADVDVELLNRQINQARLF